MTSSSAVTSLFRLNDSSPNSSTSTIPQPRRVPRRQQRGRRHRTDNELANPEDAEKADSITSPTARPQRGRQLGLSDFLSDSDSDIDYEYGSDEDVEAGALTTHINIGYVLLPLGESTTPLVKLRPSQRIFLSVC